MGERKRVCERARKGVSVPAWCREGEGKHYILRRHGEMLATWYLYTSVNDSLFGVYFQLGQT